MGGYVKPTTSYHGAGGYLTGRTLRCPECGHVTSELDVGAWHRDHPTVMQYTGEWFCNCTVAAPQRRDFRGVGIAGSGLHGPQMEVVWPGDDPSWPLRPEWARSAHVSRSGPYSYVRWRNPRASASASNEPVSGLGRPTKP